ncbi:hypothetical protein E3P89_02174 [Wallemia ichthyophaga]|uniref:Signal recognition particle SRP72 subunit RNA-binding domain-containing protein n=1 Tax=Wallemia ichthyophaga TaxID=245174 RepID=A0A4T0IBN8_WALIC|nr:hypothetical protein E3P90_02309 [Wallemia ichthyophaga]TIB13110.1 hypothetical protein E3P93_02069 [Wallemia ichthyophaga]TIB22274.1 hypothetical protein E3P89_02174 [Wallemia ichthyophaga]TIB24015.1 hypothetical protein E3P88_02265 [Wallemia ichthyophaga]
MIEKTVKYKKSPPKPENDSSVRIPALFKSLYQQILNSNYQNALKTTNKLLRLDNRSDELIKTRIFLLLQLDCFDLALDSLQQSKFSFEWAYSEYRRKNEKAAENVVESPSNTSRKWLILKAQLLYRQGDYQGAVDLYQSLLSDLSGDSEEYADISTNLKASKECLDFHKHGYIDAMETLDIPPLDVLEKNPGPFPENYKAPAVDISSVTVSHGKSTKLNKQKKKRIHAMHSKHANKNTPIDPERWIPMRERSYYRKPRQQMLHNRKTVEYRMRAVTGILALVTVLHVAGLWLFSRGFLLNRVTLEQVGVPNAAAPPATHSKAIILIIDALRADFVVPQPLDSPEYSEYYHNILKLPAQLSQQHPDHSIILHTYADPPTTTLQRIKGVMTGSLPTFIDVGNAFSGESISEDSLLGQLKRAHKSTAFVGDDTWMTVFPGSFDEQLPYDSFNVEDLHSVDAGVKEHLPRLMAHGYDAIFGHFLGVDHVGHRVGPAHAVMRMKLEEMDAVLRRVVDTLDDDTLLVVMGDHGMDSRGDHGGDSLLETSAALWMYSGRTPLTSANARANAAALPHHGSVRTTQQIDILPSLALRLGLPIPFNSLGGVIPELFPTWLLSALDTTADQIWSYLCAYAQSSSGHEIEPFLSTLREKLDAAKRGAGDAQVDLAQQERSRFWRSSRHDKANTHTHSHALYADLFASTLSSCRGIWAQFDKTLMAAGVLVVGLSLVLLLGVYSRTGRADSCVWMSSAAREAARVLPAYTAAAFVFSLALLRGRWESVVLALCLAVEGCVCWAIPLPLSSPLSFSLERPTLRTILHALYTSATLLAHLAAFLSNSYILWEDRVVLVLLQTPILLSLVGCVNAPQARLQKVLGGSALVSAVALRALASSTVCREELGGWCAVTFYATASSSLAPRWVYAALLPAALTMYGIVRAALSATASFTRSAQLFVAAFAASLAAASLYWLVDAVEFAVLPQLSKYIPYSTLTTLKTTLARSNMCFVAIAGVSFWFFSALCVEVREEGQTETKTETESHSRSQPSSQPRPTTRQVSVLGFSNSYGAYYLQYALVMFALLYIPTLPTGQISLCVALLALLAFLELSDAQNDAGALAKLIRRPQRYKKGANGAMSTPPTPSPPFWRAAWLAQLGHLVFYATGHQAVLSTLQWKAAFVGFPTLSYPYAPLLVGANTLAGFVLPATFLPLLIYWKRAPRVNGSAPLDTHLLRTACAFLAYHSAIALAAMGAAGYFRRHLMVWKVFAPRFMLAAVALLASDGALLLAVGLGAAVTTNKKVDEMSVLAAYETGVNSGSDEVLEGVEEAIYIDGDDRLGVDIQLRPRGHLEEFFESAETTRKGDERGGTVSHGQFALVHAIDDDRVEVWVGGESGMAGAAALTLLAHSHHRARYDARDVSTAAQRTTGYLTHQTTVTAAVNEWNVESLFGKSLTPQERLRRHQRALEKAQRELDRERGKLEGQESKLISDIKKSAKNGQMAPTKLMAKDLVRTRKYIQKFYQMRTQLQAVSLRIQTLRSNQQMSEAMKGATKSMAMMNRSLNLPQITRIMNDFERESSSMDMKEEIMSDAVDDVMEDDQGEEEEEKIVGQVLDDIGVTLNQQLANTPDTLDVDTGADKNKKTPMAEGLSGSAGAGAGAGAANPTTTTQATTSTQTKTDEDSLQARLDRLRKD